MIEHLMRRRSGNTAPQAEQGEEGEANQKRVQELPRRDRLNDRRPLQLADDTGVDADSVLQRVVGTSVGEIESLIRELERLRDFLNQESLHIQREIEGYGRLTDEVKTATKIIAESVAHLKNEGERIAGRAAEDSSLRSFVSSTAE
jgi:hypothetical protein